MSIDHVAALVKLDPVTATALHPCVRCVRCERHMRTTETECPFCAQANAAIAAGRALVTRQTAFRSVPVFGLAGVALECGAESGPSADPSDAADAGQAAAAEDAGTMVPMYGHAACEVAAVAPNDAGVALVALVAGALLARRRSSRSSAG